MKKHLLIILSILAVLLAGCKSKKETVAPVAETYVWQNVSMPVTLTIQQPMSLTLNGTLTMVRGQYALMSFRTFGFEVAQACVTPEEMNLVLKMPSKMWVCEPIADRLQSRSIDFTKLQDALVDDNMQSVSVNGFGVSSNDGVTTLTLSTAAKGMTLSASVSCNLKDAKWDVAKPAAFSAPGSGYRMIDLQSAAKSLGK